MWLLAGNLRLWELVCLMCKAYEGYLSVRVAGNRASFQGKVKGRGCIASAFAKAESAT